MKVTAVILAGGKGERFWPKSRYNFPKQFLSLSDDGLTMIQKTAARVAGLVATEDILVVTGENYVDIVKRQLPNMPPENIIAEPVGRNTAPCVGLAAHVIRKRYGDAVMLVLPSDHLIENEELFVSTIRTAINTALAGEYLVTIGITPTYAETGYGYIKCADSSPAETGALKVERFVEKPDKERAEVYVRSGEYLWNSGMFVWKVSVLLENFRTYLPETYQEAGEIAKVYGTNDFGAKLKEIYPKLKGESIDFGVMEKAEGIYAVPGSFGWDDVGSWAALKRINSLDVNGNVVKSSGDVIVVDTENSVFIGHKKLIAAVGVRDLVVVDTDDALLICEKDNSQGVKKVVETLKLRARTELL
ncbi:MAG: NTP transferase domain-containing protein [Clostridiales bacterium]|jgi:mannose-1-phosphate guanylyltransferase|nr:NTP transferase domain-containing protein [Clostridiales bacterium]